MKWFRLLCLSYVLIICIPAQSQKNIQLKSPDGRIVFKLESSNNKPVYQISFKGSIVIASSELGLSFEDRSFNEGLSFGAPVYRQGIENYELVVGKTKKVNEAFNELKIPIKDHLPVPRQVNLLVRLFNDAVAFRYEFPEQPGWSKLVLTDEQTNFRLAGNPTAHALFLPNYTSSHEGEYTTVALDHMKEDSLMDMPALFELPNAVFVGITEAALVDYAGMYLMKEKSVLRSKLSPLPNQSAIKVMASLPHHSPWRVIMISDRVGGLIESNILTNLNEPSGTKDWSWLKPGKTTFPWWNGNVLPDTINAPGNNFVTQQYYIDFCARNGIEYHSVVEYGLHQWYVDDGIGFQPGPHSDPTRAVPGLNMKEVCDYAKSKGVGVRIWVHFYALYPKLDSAFAQYEQWGLSGMMVDFMDRDDQEMVNMQTEILQKAAAHHLHIQFHGAYKPTGMHRTYPNEFTREGTLNYESNKWSKRVNPDHDINFPFTRMLAGSTDYHLGGFRSVTDSAFVIQYTRPLIIGTRCHMLAMYVVLENYLGMVCDYPSAYEGEPGFEFIREVPTVWDETKVLDAKPGEYIIIARRKNQDWWIGAITNHQSRELSIPFSFLSAGKYQATIFADASDANQAPNHLVKNARNLTSTDHLSIPVAGGGGFVIHLKQE